MVTPLKESQNPARENLVASIKSVVFTLLYEDSCAIGVIVSWLLDPESTVSLLVWEKFDSLGDAAACEPTTTALYGAGGA
jgi:hypothetical protein